jgi:small subunit ribosomal protein S3
VNIEEIRDVNLQAQVIAQNIAEALERRVSFRRLMKQSIEQIINAGAKGVKIAVGGRLGGADIARTEHLTSGKMPLHTIRANIDFARATAFTTFGTVGVKVWINKGELFEKLTPLVSQDGDRRSFRRPGQGDSRSGNGGERSQSRGPRGSAPAPSAPSAGRAAKPAAVKKA